MIPAQKEGGFSIDESMVWNAFFEVREKWKVFCAGHSWASEFGGGVDQDLKVLCKRLALGDYFPLPIVQMPTSQESFVLRQLGTPTFKDRVAQTVVKNQLEIALDLVLGPELHPFRSDRDAPCVIAELNTLLWKYDGMVDRKLKGFFATIDHNDLLDELTEHMGPHWALQYAENCLVRPSTADRKKNRHAPKTKTYGSFMAVLYLHRVLSLWL